MDTSKNEELPHPASTKRSRIAEVLDSALDAVITIDSKGVVVDWNEQATVMFGWSREEVRGLSLADTIIPAELAPRHTAGLARFQKTGYGPVIGKRVRLDAQDRDMNRFPVELSITPIRFDDDAAGFTGFIRDLRVEHERQEKLELSDQRLQMILDGASEGFWDIHLDSSRSALSSRCSTMLGYESGTLENGPPPDSMYIHPDDRSLVRQHWDDLLHQVAPLYDLVYRMRAEDGEWRHVHDLGEVIERDEAGNPIRMTGTRKDVTQELRLEESLMASQRMKCMGMVAGGFAHDLNNLLASIGGHAAIVSEVEGLPQRAKDSCSIIQLAVTRAKLLTENMLALGRSEDLRFGEVDPMTTIESTLALVRPRFRDEVQVTLESSIESTDLVFVDPSHFQGVLVNLLLNAQDAIEGPGSISISLEKRVHEEQSWVRICVADSGTGISLEQQSHIFKPFYTTKRPGEGIGIGLAVVQLFARSVGGSISVDSSSDHGSVFVLELPLNRGKNDQADADPASAEQPSLQVLLVEDHDLLRPMLTETMEGMGYTVISCTGITEALEHPQVKAGEFDLMVVDVNLCDGDGVEFAGRLEAIHQRTCPTVFVTGNPKSLIDHTLSPWQRALHKPFGLVDLNREIESLIKAFPPGG
ncbi:MAG: hypothetical protein CBC35_06075 [Planctomycetes bacterium TMED75]|nr:hypothetical protein [Planctomycetaceae bacterium]OUU93183.1 MAG: hypothetical protein CBC35_06075 [Planctomycetes bacterium TMED75]